MAEWPWRYRSRSKVIMHDTPSHANDHLCLIWKESIQNCRCYRVDIAYRTDGQHRDRQMDRVKPIYPPPTTLLDNYEIINVKDILTVVKLKQVPSQIACHKTIKILNQFQGTINSFPFYSNEDGFKGYYFKPQIHRKLNKSFFFKFHCCGFIMHCDNLLFSPITKCKSAHRFHHSCFYFIFVQNHNHYILNRMVH